MLDIRYIRENVEEIKNNTKNRKADVDIDELLKIDEERRGLLQKIEDLRAKRNTSSKTKPSTEEIEEIRKVGDEIKTLEETLRPVEEKYQKLLLKVPNLTHPEVKVSDDEDDNPIVETHLEPIKFDFEPLDHEELSIKLDLIDLARAAKVSGAKFYYLKNELAVLEFALIQYALEIVTKHGFTPFVTPDLAKTEVLEGLGFNPRGESTQIYNIENSDLSLIGTAEITMGGYHKDETLKEKELPKKYVAVSHCFRTEAGSYSKYSKGIFRVHQFTKVEMFEYVKPEESENAHKEILNIEKEIFSGLTIPYRVVDHTTADLGTPAYRTFDLEAWMPGKPNKEGERGDWAEITSTSNCIDYQSRGLNIKFESNDGKKELVHMLNGTAIAIGRTLIAIVENFQKKDGTISIPEVLHKYLSFKIISR
ncbi:serine--tRNA ligase [Candidatus Berkelbacteria bacterium RIFOXYA2_FULL_43_10]|uniref:Serine--tRNA ligase n=1 Tax=Candidatus Berkelbacteria bacterium RIFOXYA2_FULL_43_10 TaxID=1797472 RepID=A0A1F5E6A6_9BACT|nr:MAG: serine--tRNA ligase [Candidatus Berkelbacteria bacterium RIFOXYA2_FULL_43_10]